MFNDDSPRVLRVIKTMVFIVARTGEEAVGASVKRTIYFVMSQMIACDTEGSFSMSLWCFFKVLEKGKDVKLVEGMY